MRRRGWWILTWLLVLPCPVAWAYRPFDGTDAAVAEFGEFEPEVGVGYWRTGGQDYLLAPAVVLNFGVHERLELVLEGAGFTTLGGAPLGPRVQIGDAGVFLKGVLRRGTLQGDTGPSIALETGPIWPTLWPGGQVGGSAAVIVSMRWPGLAAHFNHEVRLGKSLDQVSAQARLCALQETNLILEGPEAWAVRPVMEVLLDYTVRAITTRSVLVGCIWSVTEAWALDIAGRVGDKDDNRVYELRAGFTWIVPMRSGDRHQSPKTPHDTLHGAPVHLRYDGEITD